MIPLGTVMGPCPKCGQDLELKEGVHGFFYGCKAFPKCRGSHGADIEGNPISEEQLAVNRARMRAHEIFDQLWIGDDRRAHKRRQAYRWMRAVLGLDVTNAHIQMLSVQGCEKLIGLVEEELLKPKDRQLLLGKEESGLVDMNTEEREVVIADEVQKHLNRKAERLGKTVEAVESEICDQVLKKTGEETEGGT